MLAFYVFQSQAGPYVRHSVAKQPTQGIHPVK